MLSENRKLVYAGNRHNGIHYRSLPEIHFTASGFFLKTFDRLCVFVFVSFLVFFFFFASLHRKQNKAENNNNKKQKKKKKKKQPKNKKKKKKNHKNNNLHDLQTGRTNTLLCRSFSDYHVKRAYSLCVIKKICIKVYLMHKTNHASLIRRLRMDRNKIRSGDKIQNGDDHKFCRLTFMSRVIQPPAIGILGVIGCFVAIVDTAAVSIVSAKSRNAFCFSG